MELVNNTVWIVKGNDCFAIFSSKAYAEAYKQSLIKIWEKSICRDTIPRRLNNQLEYAKYGDDYPDVIRVGEDYYELIRSDKSSRDGYEVHWRYDLFSHKDWKDYRRRFVSGFVIEDYLILK